MISDKQLSRISHICAIFILAGCAPVQSYVRAHSEASLPASSVALLKPAAGIYINEVDGKPMTFVQDYVRSTDFEIEFLPGMHQLRIGYYNGTLHSSQTVLIHVDMKAGHRYLLKPNSTHNSFKSNEWRPEVIDVTGKPDCWTVKVGVWGGPKEC